MSYLRETNATIQITDSFLNIVGAGTTTAKTGAGVLRRIVICGDKGESAVLYDSLSGGGTVIATLSLMVQGSIDFDCVFSTGLTLVVTGADSNVTVICR